MKQSSQNIQIDTVYLGLKISKVLFAASGQPHHIMKKKLKRSRLRQSERGERRELELMKEALCHKLGWTLNTVFYKEILLKCSIQMDSIHCIQTKPVKGMNSATEGGLSAA